MPDIVRETVQSWPTISMILENGQILNERQSKNQTDAATRTELMQKARQYIKDCRQQKQYPSAHKKEVIEEIQKKKIN